MRFNQNLKNRGSHRLATSNWPLDEPCNWHPISHHLCPGPASGKSGRSLCTRCQAQGWWQRDALLPGSGTALARWPPLPPPPVPSTQAVSASAPGCPTAVLMPGTGWCGLFADLPAPGAASLPPPFPGCRPPPLPFLAHPAHWGVTWEPLGGYGWTQWRTCCRCSPATFSSSSWDCYSNWLV